MAALFPSIALPLRLRAGKNSFNTPNAIGGDARDTDRDRRRRADDPANQQTTAEAQLALLVRPRAFDLAQQSEREIAVGSRAFRHEATLADGRAQLQQRRGEFASAMKEARQSRSRDSAENCTAEARRNAESANVESGESEVGAPLAPVKADSRSSQLTKASAPAALATAGDAADDAHAQPSAQPVASQSTVSGPVQTRTVAASVEPARTSGATVGATQPVAGAPVAPQSAAVSVTQPSIETATEAQSSTTTGEAKAAGGDAADAASGVDGTRARGNDRANRSAGTTTGTGASDEAQHADSAESRENLDRLMRVLRTQIVSGRGTAVLKLDPPKLGSLRIQMDLQRDGLALTLDPQTELAHRLLTGSVDELRRDLRAAGIDVTSVEIRSPIVSGLATAASAERNPSEAAQQEERDGGEGTFAASRSRTRGDVSRVGGAAAGAIAGAPSESTVGRWSRDGLNILA